MLVPLHFSSLAALAPRNAKMEISKEQPFNPIIQDVRDGKPRSYNYHPEARGIFMGEYFAPGFCRPGQVCPKTRDRTRFVRKHVPRPGLSENT